MSVFGQQPPEWDNAGLDPGQTVKINGWSATQKPPAEWFNWLFNRIYNCIIEIRNLFDSHVLDYTRNPGYAVAVMPTQDNYTITLSVVPTAYTDGMRVAFQIPANGANTTTTPTLNINNLGAKTIRKNNGNAVNIGDLQAGYTYEVTYNTTQGVLILSGGDTDAVTLNGKAASSYALSLDLVTTNSNVSTNTANISTVSSNLVSHMADDTKHVGYAVTTNSGNAYSVTIPNLTALTDGLVIRVKFNAASTGAISVNANSLGIKNVVDYFGNAVTNVRANLPAQLCYESSSGNFILLGKGGGGNATANDLRTGKTATTDTGPINGALADNGALGTTLSNQGQSYTIPSGITTGGTVTANITNLIASNIVSGEIVGGVAGSAIACAKGSAISASSGTDSFNKTSSGTVALPYLTVSGLALPSAPSVLIVYSNYDVIVYTSSCHGGDIIAEKVTSSDLSGYTADTFNYLTSASPANISASGFTMPVYYNNSAYNWIAIV